MNQNINSALKRIELSKKAISEAEEILATLLQGDAVPSVEEPEPARDQWKLCQKCLM